MNTEVLFEKLTKAVSFLYAEDPTSPGVLVSSLRNGEFYVSIQRFKKSGGKDKVIVFKTNNTSLRNALLGAASFLTSQKPDSVNPLDELKQLTREDKIAKALTRVGAKLPEHYLLPNVMFQDLPDYSTLCGK